jgi:integrase
LLIAAGLGTAPRARPDQSAGDQRLRISEALGADIDDLGLDRGHRTLTVLRKGGKLVTIPLVPRTARAIDLAIGERLTGQSSYASTAVVWTGTAPGGSSAGSRTTPD